MSIKTDASVADQINMRPDGFMWCGEALVKISNICHAFPMDGGGCEIHMVNGDIIKNPHSSTLEVAEVIKGTPDA